MHLTQRKVFLDQNDIDHSHPFVYLHSKHHVHRINEDQIQDLVGIINPVVADDNGIVVMLPQEHEGESEHLDWQTDDQIDLKRDYHEHC